MKNVTVSMLIVALLAAGVCVFAVNTVEAACSAVERLCVQAKQLSEHGLTEQALEAARQMLFGWRRYEGRLTAVLPHSTIGEVELLLLEAQADILAGEAEDFLSDMMLLEELLKNIRSEERLHMSNILSIC